MREKSYVEDIDRSIYDFKDDEKDAYKVKAGLTPEIVQKISDEKKDPAWMQLFRLHSLQIYNQMPIPDWGPSIEGLNMDDIVTYVRPNTKMKAKWSDVPDDIKNTFERLGIPQAERKSLAGVGAQYDSELVYHNVRAEVAAQGVVYTDMESALHGEYADMVRKHFMKLVKPTDHKFAALHGAVWSGGSFVYVPKGVSVEIPLQSYFRLNAPGAGQFEHTLIIVDEDADLHFIEGCSAPKYNVANLHAGCVELFVGKNARLRYSTIENWSKNMYNLNTKRAQVEEGGKIEWVSGSFGSHVSYLYPMSVLKGRGAKMEFTGITFAGKGQNLDTGAKVVHSAPDTSSYINTKSISKDGGISTFRSSVSATKAAKNTKSAVSCQSLMLDDISRSDTIPAMDIRTKDANIGHEAQIGSINERTRLVAVAQVSNVLGCVNPLQKITEMAHRVGAVVVVDGAQSVPHMPVDVQALDADFLAFSGHKLMGPMGIGCLYGKLELLEKMPPFLTGGEMIDSVHRDGAVFAPVPQKFEAGTVNAAGAVGLAAAIRYLQEKGFDYIQKKELELTQRAMEGLGALPYVHILGSKDPANHTGIVSFTIDGVHPHDVSEILSSDGIDVRAGHHCAQPLLEYLGVRSSTRASMMFYNTPEEIDALIESVSTIRRRMGYGE